MLILSVIVALISYRFFKSDLKVAHLQPKTPPIEISKEVFVAVKSSRKKREASPLNKVYKDRFKEFSGTKILLAEDDEINQKVLLALLEDSGIAIDIASNGKEALELLEKSSYALVLMDSNMPILNGEQTTRAIRANPSYDHLPVVALSGELIQSEVDLMFEAGVDEYLQKPLKPKALYDIFYSFISTSQESSFDSESFEELDVSRGLETVGGDRDFYKTILKDFTLKYIATPAQIYGFLKDANKQKAQALLLDISGISANIGATELNQASLELQKALVEHKSLEFILKLKEFDRVFKRTIEAIYKTTRV
ncbi:MAG: response regulator [Sulfurimonas sp.]|jgi:CheY-like chemotaxis protein|nr:response regulator [Sulfurimonadaceae bacterium]